MVGEQGLLAARSGDALRGGSAAGVDGNVNLLVGRLNRARFLEWAAGEAAAMGGGCGVGVAG